MPCLANMDADTAESTLTNQIRQFTKEPLPNDSKSVSNRKRCRGRIGPLCEGSDRRHIVGEMVREKLSAEKSAETGITILRPDTVKEILLLTFRGIVATFPRRWGGNSQMRTSLHLAPRVPPLGDEYPHPACDSCGSSIHSRVIRK